MLVGYARISTLDQTLDLQRDALEKAGCERIYTDRISGSRAERPGLADALEFVRSDDTIVVWRLDRLGRSLQHLIVTVQELADKGVGFRSLTESIDTTSPGGTGSSTSQGTQGRKAQVYEYFKSCYGSNAVRR